MPVCGTVSGFGCLPPINPAIHEHEQSLFMVLQHSSLFAHESFLRAGGGGAAQLQVLSLHSVSVESVEPESLSAGVRFDHFLIACT